MRLLHLCHVPWATAKIPTSTWSASATFNISEDRTRRLADHADSNPQTTCSDLNRCYHVLLIKVVCPLALVPPGPRAVVLKAPAPHKIATARADTV